MRSLEGALTAQPNFRKDVAENAGALDSPKGADTRDDGDEVSVLEVRATVCLFFLLIRALVPDVAEQVDPDT